MISSKKDLKYYLDCDLKRYPKKPNIKDRLLHNESWYIYKYLYHLRHVEFYKNTNPHSIWYLWHFYKYKTYSFKCHMTIYPNTVGPGLHVYHIGDFIHVKPECKIGKNCTLLPGVVFGNKYETESKEQVFVGDNCYFGLGVRVFGNVKIGNNVIIGANTVITKDIPDNCVVAGNPSKIIRKISDRA